MKLVDRPSAETHIARPVADQPIRIVLEGRRDLRALAAGNPDRYPCLLESGAASANVGRYDFLCFSEGEFLEAATPGEGESFLRELEVVLASEHRIPDAAEREAPAFAGGWVLFLAYEMAMVCEPSLRLPAARSPWPAALALRCPAALVMDRKSNQTWLVAEAGREDLIATMRSDLSGSTPFALRTLGDLQIREAPEATFLDAVAKIRAHIAAGDIFQANLSRRWDIEFERAPRPADLHSALSASNPAPFAALLQWRGNWIVSSSPERLVTTDGKTTSTRPIAGTRPRHAGDDDELRRAELIAHPKERAEHVMLLDLERNDLGRVCEPGSVVVDEMMVLETYAHVHHIVSNVSGRLRKDVSPIDVIRAVFPGGTITGAPKVRCMQIISELEGEGRGAYTGSLGWLSVTGNMDLNILIRSFEGRGASAHFRAGAGIVADSDAATELAETRAKARGLLRALDTPP